MEVIGVAELAKELFENNEVRILGTIDEPLFVATDIAKVLGNTNIHTSVKEFDESEKGIQKVHTRRGKQTMTLLTCKGMKRLLVATRRNVSIGLLKYFKIDEIRFTPKETEFIHNIRLAFSDIKFVEQYAVDKYRVDLYAVDYKLAIEFDERYHNHRCLEDNSREQIITNIINCQFIRIPYNENIFASIDRIRRKLNALYSHKTLLISY